MPNLKRPMIRLLAVILSVVFWSLFILGEPASAETDDLPLCSQTITEHCLLIQDTNYQLDLNAGYKIKLKSANQTPSKSDVDCYRRTIYARFNFKVKNSESQDVDFSETYPIQENWELHFNTPLSGDLAGVTGTLKIEKDTECKLEVEAYPNQTLELFSGFKSTNDQEIGNQDEGKKATGRFVIARDYYAVTERNQANCENQDSDNYFNDETNICYERLGSLTGITGKNFPALGGAVVAQIIIKPNSIRAPHWHLQFAEAGYCYEGIGQVGIIVPSNTIPKLEEEEEEKDGSYYSDKIVEEIFLKENEVFLFPEGSQHYLRNIGNEDFKCALFFTEGTPLNGNQLLTITLQNIVGNTPKEVLGSVFAMNKDGNNNTDGLVYTPKQISQSPAQAFSSRNQGPNVIPVVEACSGDKPDIMNPGCHPKPPTEEARIRFSSSLYSDMDP